MASQGRCKSQFLSGRSKAKQFIFSVRILLLCVYLLRIGCVTSSDARRPTLPTRTACSDGLVQGFILDFVRASPFHSFCNLASKRLGWTPDSVESHAPLVCFSSEKDRFCVVVWRTRQGSSRTKLLWNPFHEYSALFFFWRPYRWLPSGYALVRLGSLVKSVARCANEVLLSCSVVNWSCSWYPVLSSWRSLERLMCPNCDVFLLSGQQHGCWEGPLAESETCLSHTFAGSPPESGAVLLKVVLLSADWIS